MKPDNEVVHKTCNLHIFIFAETDIIYSAAVERRSFD
jgi:hypothetical protein